MNDHQLSLLAQLIHSMDGDPVAQADLNAYGKAYDQLAACLCAALIQRCSQLSLTAKELYPA